jgi:hypothetical protein
LIESADPHPDHGLLESVVSFWLLRVSLALLDAFQVPQPTLSSWQERRK